MRQIAISDIHGCLKTFDALLDMIGLTASDELYLLGDYIDRGPNSKGVIDQIWALQAGGYQVFCLRGNHEELLLNATNGRPSAQAMWLNNGGDSTMQSFGLGPEDPPGDIPGNYLDFLGGLPYYYEPEGYFLVHAGLDFRLPDPLEGLAAMLWIRDWYSSLDKDWLRGRVIVHGHTPLYRPLIQNQLNHLSEFPVIDIDAGCVYSLMYLNNMCAFDLASRQLFFQKNIDIHE
ncbi:MAG: serine/threonine protein phosphatase [Phaeodactylibacter sp.]|nr:serine/threonine protein phosphatase [Phaeodactylibacter sp.]MCB9273000.1 serine/threonine protein phosphatase [Lewinellaceae bacterium]